jgi:hypothetical protein
VEVYTSDSVQMTGGDGSGRQPNGLLDIDVPVIVSTPCPRKALLCLSSTRRNRAAVAAGFPPLVPLLGDSNQFPHYSVEREQTTGY